MRGCRLNQAWILAEIGSRRGCSRSQKVAATVAELSRFCVAIVANDHIQQYNP